jgi:cellulose synthase/poly-beta-1,6-N-acetylglucosamine synthase-like glycosyltransferase
MVLIEIITDILVIQWSIISIFVILGLIGFLFYKSKKSNHKSKNYEITIVSKASANVKNSLFRCLNNNKHFGFINLVIDEECELETELKKYCKDNKINLYIVPKNYNIKAIAKGRAIQYFIDTNVKDLYKWYIFIDDDNIIMDDTFLYEIDYYDNSEYKAFNAIIKPIKSSSNITYIADFLRYFDDLTIFRFGTGLLGKPINGMHGELLGVKGEVLKRIGFNRKTITEDFCFSRELIRANIKTWQSETIISILSPHNISDFIKQRKRWYKGNSKDVLDAPLIMKIFAGVKIYDWYIGIIGSWITLPLWFILPFNIPLWLKLFTSIGMVYYIFAYFYGSFIFNKGLWRLGFILTPIFSIMENFSPHYWNGSKHGFDVIRK